MHAKQFCQLMFTMQRAKERGMTVLPELSKSPRIKVVHKKTRIVAVFENTAQVEGYLEAFKDGARS